MGRPAARFTAPSHERPTLLDVGDLVLVSGRDCHLCAHGREVLAGLGLAWRELDVESDEADRLARQGLPLAFLPVLLDGGRVLGYGRLSEKRLRRELGL